MNGIPDSEQIEEWAEAYFESLLRMMNLFYARTDLTSVLESMEAIKFSQMAAQELAGETPEVIATATKMIDEIAAREIEYIKAYMP
ncbi:MAG: hypothetical protein VB084_15685 [Syntrophomonadaceae bacterium]|nr:hypothetical protein [Syntrophomonadaceae bacterium]